MFTANFAAFGESDADCADFVEQPIVLKSQYSDFRHKNCRAFLGNCRAFLACEEGETNYLQ